MYCTHVKNENKSSFENSVLFPSFLTYRIYFLAIFLAHRLTWILPSVLVALFAVMLVVQWPATRRQVAEYFFDSVLNVDIDNSDCALEIPDQFLDLIRPPADCSVCEGLESVDRVAGISPATFEQRYAYTGKFP